MDATPSGILLLSIIAVDMSASEAQHILLGDGDQTNYRGLHQAFGSLEKTIGSRQNKDELRLISDRFALVQCEETTSGVRDQRLISVLFGVD